MNLARRVIRYELGMWRSLYRWVVRKPYGEGVRFSYASAITPVLVGIIVVSFIEIPVVHMIVPGETLKLIVDVLGVYALLWMVGLLASMRVHPHTISETGLRVRYGFSVDITIPWENIESVRTRTRSLEKSKTVQHIGEVLNVAISSQTNVDVVLREPFQGATELRFYADDASGLVKLASATRLERQAG